ncbi:hypothetical protein [Actinoplanes subtropicus]|uniref:hypothetical protein n=1 Tax=Actinoplanes subtropicus TaxID=543632 RepID=UPI0012FA27EA|nr:hypothetical protein [Actinoplanes subtropicus]
MVGRDGPARLLGAAVRVLPAGRRDWGRAMQAELAAIEDPADRRGFAWGCLRAAAVEFHLLRGALHVLAVLAVAGTLVAWAATVNEPPLAWMLSTVVSLLAVVCWAARKAGMLGPTDDGVAAWLLRGGGYLIAVAVAAVALAHSHPATLEAADAGSAVLGLSTIGAGFLVGVVSVAGRRSAATARVLITGVGSALAATAGWLLVVLLAPPIPATVGWALAATAVAAVLAVLANAGESSTIQACLLAGLIATAATMALIFGSVELLAHLGPDRLIPDITPAALPGQHISESRTEIVDPYVLILFLAGAAATVLGLAAVATRRPVAGSSRSVTG